MTAEEFASLLSLFGPDRDQAAERYESTRRKLIWLFERWGCELPQELTDETFDRVAAKRTQGLELRNPDPYIYICGVARFVFKEYLRDRAKEKAAIDSGDLWHSYPIGQEDDPEDDRLDGLRSCLDQLTHEERQLLLDYHGGEDLIRVRKRLAEELGNSLNALRIRVHRIRQRVETCLERCLESKER